MRLHRINALLWKYWYITINRLDRVFDIFYWPLTGLLVWGFTTYWLQDLTNSNIVVNVFLGGIIMWTFFLRANQDIALYILEDFWSRNLNNLFATPMTTGDLISSNIMLGFVRSTISFAFLIGIAALLYGFNMLSIGLLGLVLYAFGLLLFGWVLGMFVAGLIFRYGMRVQVFAWGIPWVVQPFSAVFYPLDSLPVWLQNISLAFPTTYMFEGMRHALDTGEILFRNLGISYLLNIVFFILAFWFFASSIKKSKKTGLLARYGE